MSIVKELADWRCWILARVVPREDGKTDKIPCDPLTGQNVDGQDPANWMTGAEAELWAAQRGAGYWPGLVLHPNFKIFALDLDNCRDVNGGWLPHVHAFLNRFPAAAVETSVSGNGRHMFVRYTGELPAHGTRNKIYRMEAYSKARFILTTGHEAAGSVMTDATKLIGPFLAEYFPEHDEPDHGVEWTDKPVTAWKGPQDDAQLISRALRATSAHSIFGGGAAFSDLWRADSDILSKAFPPQTNAWPWDRSSADQALANHLAFWTGNDCERMSRLMWQSGLTRDKWHRPDYIRRTVLEATGTQREWYTEPAAPAVETSLAQYSATDANATPVAVPLPPGVPPPPTVPAPPTVTIEVGVPPPPGAPQQNLGPTLKPGELPPVGEYASIHTMKQLFAGFCYVQDLHAIQLPDGSTITKERMDAKYGGPQYAMTADGQKPTKSAWDAYTLSEIHRFPRVETQYFKPADALGNIRENDGRREINSYRPANMRRVKGDPAPFLDLLNRMLPQGKDAQILISYMAACCRYLGIKFSWWPFIQGCKGNGKTTVAKILEYCMSLRYTHWAKADQLGEKFNSVLVGKLLLVVDEMYSDDARQLQEILKQLVTSDRIEVRPMYAEKTMKEVCFNGLLISNHQNGVRIDLDERRYAPLFCAQQSKADRLRDGLDNMYFINLRKWLWGNDAEGAAIVYDFLMSYDIPDEFNPATFAIVAPLTTSTEVAATASLGGIEQELIEAIKQQHDGFRNGWVSSQAVDFLLARTGRDKSIPRNARKGLVTSLGLVPHPSLPNGQLSVPLSDGHKPFLYIERGHPWAVDYLSPEQVRQGFLDAQKL